MFEQVTTVPEFDKDGVTTDAKGMLAYAYQILASSRSLADKLEAMNCHSLISDLKEALYGLGVDDPDND